MAHQFTTVAMTHNLWGLHRWPEREPALRALLETRDPDLLAVQELAFETRDVIDEVLPLHQRVEDGFPGWSSESNIWWRRDLYRLDDFGAEDIGIRSFQRRLFWVRLKPLLLDGGRPLVFATAHLTWPGDRVEESEGSNPRIGEATRAVEVLDRLSPNGACVFVGDLNEFHHPIRILRAAGFSDSFGALGCSSPVTAPVDPLDRPTSRLADVPRVIDYQFHRGPIGVRTSEVVEFFLGNVAPSDHRPVVATYTLRS